MNCILPLVSTTAIIMSVMWFEFFLNLYHIFESRTATQNNTKYNNNNHKGSVSSRTHIIFVAFCLFYFTIIFFKTQSIKMLKRIFSLFRLEISLIVSLLLFLWLFSICSTRAHVYFWEIVLYWIFFCILLTLNQLCIALGKTSLWPLRLTVDCIFGSLFPLYQLQTYWNNITIFGDLKKAY